MQKYSDAKRYCMTKNKCKDRVKNREYKYCYDQYDQHKACSAAGMEGSILFCILKSEIWIPLISKYRFMFCTMILE